MITRNNEQAITNREQMRGGKGTVKLTSLVSELPENARLFSKITLVPGSSIGYHVHTNETELFYFVQGSGLANDDGVTYQVQAGDAMATANGHGHGVENNGNVDMVILAAIIKDPAV